MRWYGLNRTLCDVLEDMRVQLKLNTPINKNLLASLVEEAQIMGNRMEAGLGDLHDRESLLKEIKALKEKAKKLKAETGDTDDD